MSDVVKRERQEKPAAPELMRGGTTYSPRVDILEKDDELTIYGDLPGVEPGDVDIQFENHELVIHGKVAQRHQDVKYLYSEFGIGDFYRAFAVGEQVDVSKISAEMKDGVLILHLPKSEGVRPRRIRVQGG